MRIAVRRDERTGRTVDLLLSSDRAADELLLTAIRDVFERRVPCELIIETSERRIRWVSETQIEPDGG